MKKYEPHIALKLLKMKSKFNNKCVEDLRKGHTIGSLN